jgi:hypothetical protein
VTAAIVRSVLSSWDIGVVSQAFGVGQRQVVADVVLITTARGSADDLLAVLRTRHDWTAANAYRYLRTLRLALRGGPISL